MLIKSKTKLESLVSKEHYEKGMSYIKLAVKNGHKIVYGETVDKAVDCDQNGYYILPTIITNLDYQSALMKGFFSFLNWFNGKYWKKILEEIFGPVVCVVPFHDEDEVIKRANNIKYGLAATVWTENLAKARKISNVVMFGLIAFWVRDLRISFGGNFNV